MHAGMEEACAQMACYCTSFVGTHASGLYLKGAKRTWGGGGMNGSRDPREEEGGTNAPPPK